MAKRGLKYLIRRIKQVVVLTVGTALFLGLCFVSITQAENDTQEAPRNAASPVKVMQVLMGPAGVPVDKCLTEEELPIEETCKPFFNVDEDALENLLHNYTTCLDGHSFYYDFSNQPTVKLTKTLKIYARTDEPLIVKGLKIEPSDSFPKDEPAVVIYGKSVELKDAHIEGFETDVLYASDFCEEIKTN